MYLGELIKKYRTENKVSQRDFAKLCNLSHTYIAALEKNIDQRTGKPIAPTLDTVKYVAKAMNMQIETVLHLLEDNQEFIMNEDAPKYNDDFRYAEYNGINTDGLDETDIEEIKQYVEFVRSKKNKENNNK